MMMCAGGWIFLRLLIAAPGGVASWTTDAAEHSAFRFVFMTFMRIWSAYFVAIFFGFSQNCMWPYVSRSCRAIFTLSGSSALINAKDFIFSPQSFYRVCRFQGRSGHSDESPDKSEIWSCVSERTFWVNRFLFFFFVRRVLTVLSVIRFSGRSYQIRERSSGSHSPDDTGSEGRYLNDHTFLMIFVLTGRRTGGTGRSRTDGGKRSGKRQQKGQWKQKWRLKTKTISLTAEVFQIRIV